MATTFHTASYAVTSGVVTDGVASALDANSGCACFESEFCSVVVGASTNEQLAAGTGSPKMLGYVYSPTTLSGIANSPATLKWMRCSDIDFLPTVSAQFSSSGGLRLPPGSMRFIHLPFQMATTGGSTFTVMQAAKRSGT